MHFHSLSLEIILLDNTNFQSNVIFLSNTESNILSLFGRCYFCIFHICACTTWCKKNLGFFDWHQNWMHRVKKNLQNPYIKKLARTDNLHQGGKVMPHLETALETICLLIPLLLLHNRFWRKFTIIVSIRVCQLYVKHSGVLMYP